MFTALIDATTAVTAGGASVIIPAIVGAIGGTLIAAVTGYMALKKAPTQRAQDQGVLVDAAEDVVLLQRGVISELREELANIRREMVELRNENIALEEEVVRLRGRVTALEAELDRIEHPLP